MCMYVYIHMVDEQAVTEHAAKMAQEAGTAPKPEDDGAGTSLLGRRSACVSLSVSLSLCVCLCVCVFVCVCVCVCVLFKPRG